MMELRTPEELMNLNFFAHKRKSQYETLLAHSTLTIEYYHQYCEKKEIDLLVKNLIGACGFDETERCIAYDLFVHAIYLHDAGKINPKFQYCRLENSLFKHQKDLATDSNHSPASAYIYIDQMRKHYSDDEISWRLEKLLNSFAFCISKHHSGLSDAHNYDQLIELQIDYYTGKIDDDILNEIQPTLQYECDISDPVAFYILNRLLFAMIVNCDFCATQEYMTGIKTNISIIEDLEGMLARYRGSEIYQNIQQYKKNPHVFEKTKINQVRSDLFIESENNLIDNPNAHIYYLEAPTGAGKTNMAINLTLKILEQNKAINNVFYIFPFNALIEQTFGILESYFGNDVKVVNSITSLLPSKSPEGAVNYEAVWLDHIFNNYPIVVTSHVNFFSALFGAGKEQCFPLLKLCNSVVVLDEIQSYKNAIWTEIITFLQKYSKLLNIKVIIMSATLPKLDGLLKVTDAHFVSLIQNTDKYYQNPLFKNRVEMDFSLLETSEFTLEILRDEVLKHSQHKVLVEFIKKKTARTFYELCKEAGVDVEILTGDDNVARRVKIIKRAKEAVPFILVATQTIEAGVDINMTVGFKDISLFDSEEQFLGRINRSCTNEIQGKAFFFNLDKADEVYKGDLRLAFTVLNPDVRQLVINKNFGHIYESVFEALIKKKSGPNTNNLKNLINCCTELKFEEIEKIMNLIEPNLQLFIPYYFESEDIDGYEVWYEYKGLCENLELSYSERKVKMLDLARKMSYFTFNTYYNKKPFGVEIYGGYYFIQDGSKFIDDEGILNRDELEKAYDGRFL